MLFDLFDPVNVLAILAWIGLVALCRTKDHE